MSSVTVLVSCHHERELSLCRQQGASVLSPCTRVVVVSSVRVLVSCNNERELSLCRQSGCKCRVTMNVCCRCVVSQGASVVSP